ncbi:sensor histidine kinase [Streptomyces violascens]|uniref:sensor histidine kinase n=1 Tax=Streptomyces violascens TaxID=67381 RepID=UPI0037B4B16E
MKTELARRQTRQLSDAAVTAAVVVLGVVNSWAKPSNGLLTGLPTPTIAVVSGAVGVLLWWRRRWPRLIASLVIAAHLVAFTPTALAVAMYTLGNARREMRTLVLFTVAGIVADAVAIRSGLPDTDLREAAYSLAFIVGPLAVGYAVAVHRAMTTEVQSRLAGMKREQDLMVERAQIAERARIAREMHDVVAHRVGNIVLTASALEADPAAQTGNIAEKAGRIREEGHQALTELRELLGVLKPARAGRPAPRTPQPDASQLAELVEGVRELGHLARLHVNGYPEILPDQLQRAIYRVVQEALSNVAKHAPGAEVDVTVNCQTDGVQLAVTNGAPARTASVQLPSGGHGLVGLRERVRLLGGTLDAGPDGGGYQVAAWIPHGRRHHGPAGP